MDKVLLQYLDANHYNGFGMATTAIIPFSFDKVTGKIQLKWWKQQGTLIIKTIQIQPVGHNILTPAVLAVLACPVALNQGLKSIVLESVISPELRKKLLLRGWKSVTYNEYNLFMECM